MGACDRREKLHSRIKPGASLIAVAFEIELEQGGIFEFLDTFILTILNDVLLQVPVAHGMK